MTQKPLARLALVAGVCLLIAPFASRLPDGLEYVAAKFGLVHHGTFAGSLLPNYTVPGVEHRQLGTIIAGAIGAVAVAGVSIVLGRLLSIRRGRRDS